MLDKLTISKETGEVINVDLVSVFLIPDIKKQFMITTTNEIDPNGLVKLHVSEIKSNKLYKVESDDDWAAIKTVMRSIISSSAGNYQYLSPLLKAESVADYTRGIAVQIVAKEQLATDYNKNKPTDMAIKKEAQVIPEVETIATSAHVMTETTIDASQGNIVAPGIVETPSTDNNFQSVQITEKPTDLIIAEPAVPKADELGLEPVIAETPTPAPEIVDEPVINIETPTPAIEIPTPAAEVKSEPIVEAQPVVAKEPVATPAPVASTPANFDMNTFQQMFQQMMAMQQGSVSQPVSGGITNPLNIKLTEEEFNKIASDARDIFMESAKNLADVIITNAYDKIKAKEEELNRKEIILVQRETAINQQTLNAVQNTNPEAK